ncbi:hypothetical protein OJF2_74730 [Aquisphaera giovannonii]|uniref:YcfA-like protein n=1 Tax=Aquisphaera giovannonii TaxID=406548 RepID=A0A5B9WEG5_9BACT|nr:hypothetical protein OJF2_74730 [Aquisphaera giovannonii]
MKRVDPVRTIEGSGCMLVRHGGRHDRDQNPATGVSRPIARHREIREHLARHIIAMLANPSDETEYERRGADWPPSRPPSARWSEL